MNNKVLTFVPTDSYLEVITDAYDNKYNIHFHKVGDEWSATEETTGARCVPGTYETRALCREKVIECSCLYKKLLSTKHMIEAAEKLKEFKENLI
jgi:hypothetical protein